MRIKLIETDVSRMNFGQLELDVPKIKGWVSYDPRSNEAVIADSVTLDQADIALIENHAFDLSKPAPKYRPGDWVRHVKSKGNLRAALASSVGLPPATFGQLKYIQERGGLDESGNIKPLDEWVAFTPFEIAIKNLPPQAAQQAQAKARNKQKSE